MILISKIKMAAVLGTCVLLPISSIVVAENKTKNVKMTKDKAAVSSNESVTNKELVGTWKLTSKSDGYPHKLDSTLTIKKDGTFALTEPKATGKFTSDDNNFSFNFGGKMIIPFTYKLSGDNKLEFTLAQSACGTGCGTSDDAKDTKKDFTMAMTYEKVEKK